MRILVVDDEKEIRDFLKIALESECFEVDVAKDGEEGSFLARTNDYDLIILDNNMPKKEGREVCHDIRNDGKDMPIIMLSVVSEPYTKADLLNIGADDYLVKPFSFEELLARIRAIFRRSKEMKSDVIKVDDLTIDSGKHLVKRGDREIYLTVKEFMLLECLARNKGYVVSRGMILEHVWDMNADLFSNTIEVHISSLRHKVDLPGLKKIIHTVPGRGYKLDLP